MKANFEIGRSTKVLATVVIVVHLMFFMLESLFWMMPEVHNILLDFLNNPVAIDYNIQALTLKNLFINQGFYNLFLVIAGLAGFRLITKKKYAVGYALLLFLCFSATGAGLVLALTTKAYILALFQALPAAMLFVKLYPFYKIVSDNEKPTNY